MQNEILSLARQYDVVQNIMPHINEKTLIQAYWSQPDTATKVLYGKELKGNIQKLLCRMKKFSYFPKGNLGNSIGPGQEFGLIEDAVVEYAFAEILRKIYIAKNPVIFSPKDRKFQNAGNRITLYPYVWRTKFLVSNKSVDQKKMIDFLGEYTADKNFLKYLKRFLDIGIMEKQILPDAELASDKTLTSILMKIYCYHILREWLCSKGNNLQGKVYLSFHKEYFCFGAYNLKDLLKICNGLVDGQEQTELQIASSTYIEDIFGEFRRSSLKVYSSSKDRRKIGRRTL